MSREEAAHLERRLFFPHGEKMLRRLCLVAVCAMIVIWLAATRPWNPDKPGYWRHQAQTALLRAAHFTPAKFKASVTRAALKVDIASTTYEESTEAAVLLEEAGARLSAAMLWLGLVRSDVEAGSSDQAFKNASRAYSLARTPEIVATLLILSDASERGRLGAELYEIAPAHDLASTIACISRLNDFAYQPYVCSTVSWLAPALRSRRAQYETIGNAIGNLPFTKAIKISEYEEGIRSLEAENSQIAGDLTVLEQRLHQVNAKGTGWAIGQAFRNFIGLPRQGQQLGDWAAEQAVCLVPVIRGVCRFSAILSPFAEVGALKKQLNEGIAKGRSSIESNEYGIVNKRSWISYYQSDAPLNTLLKEREQLVPDFRGDAHRAITAQRQNAGLAMHEALLAAVMPQKASDSTLVAGVGYTN